MKTITSLLIRCFIFLSCIATGYAQSSPFVNCQQGRSFAIGANGTVTVAFGQVSAGSGASAGESVVIRSIFPNVFDCDDIGLQTVGLTIQDSSGQNAFCSTTILITDGQDPVLSCPDDITIATDPLSPVNVTYDSPTVSECTVGLQGPENTTQSFTHLGFYTDPDGDVRSYYLSEEPIALEDAFDQATSFGGNLVTVIEQGHNDWLRESINFVTGTTDLPVLLGYTDRFIEGSFLWYAGPENDGYENWNSGEPNNQGDEDFTVMLASGRWNDAPGTQQRRYLLQLSPSATPIIRQTAGLPSGSEFPVGTTTNTFEVTDGFGNTSTCSFDVTIEGVPPIPVTLAAGDIAFMGSNTDPGSTTIDNVSFVLLKDITADTQIIFTDRGWSDTEGFSPTNVGSDGDGQLTWTSGIDRVVGDIITLDLSPGNLSDNAVYSRSGDQLFAIQGNIGNPTFIAGLNFGTIDIIPAGLGIPLSNDENWNNDFDISTPDFDATAFIDNLSALPDELTTGDTAVFLFMPGNDGAKIARDNFRFSCTLAGGSPITGTPAQIRAVLHNRDNWNFSNTVGFNPPVENGCSITIGVDTEVSLNAGTLTITDVNGGISNDNITLSSDDTTLTISNLIGASVSGGPVLTGPTTVTVPLASITNGIIFNAEGGNNTASFGDLTLTGTDNSITLNGIQGYSQSGTIDIEGDFIIAGNAGGTIALSSINARSLSITGVDRINDAGGTEMNISGPTTLQTILNINLNSGVTNNTQFGGVITLTASSVFFSSRSSATFGAVTTTGTDNTILNGLTVTEGDMTLSGPIQNAGNSNLSLRVLGGNMITQTASGTITTNSLRLQGNTTGTSAALLDIANNDISSLRVDNVNNPIVDLTFRDINTIELQEIIVDDLNLTANSFIFSENTAITKNGNGTSSFNGNINVTATDAANPAVINHNTGTLNFQGSTNNFDGAFDYIGAAGTTTNFNGTTTLDPQGISLGFGFLNVTEPLTIRTLVTTLNEARFNEENALLKGLGTLSGGPIIFENGATITPGIPGEVSNISLSDLLISSATFAPVTDNADDFDILEVVGTVTLTDATLDPIGGFIVQQGDEIIIIENDGADAVIGTFNNLPEGSAITFGEFEGIITYTGGDGNDIALLSGPETDVDLSGGILSITDINGGTSDDNITLSNDGTTLTISGLVSPVGVSAGVTLVTDTSVSVPLADITDGFLFESEDGNDTITINDPITINNPNSFIAITSIDNFIQNGALTIGGDIFLEGTDSDLILGEITASSLSLRLFNNVDDSAGRLNISDVAMREISGIVNIDNGAQNESNHTFGNIVDIDAFRVANFTAGSDLNIAIRTTATNGVNTITASPGGITLSGESSTAGASDLNLVATSFIQQPNDASLTTRELTITASTTAVFLGTTNDINRLHSTNSLEFISFIDIDVLALGAITTGEFAFTASEIFLDTETLVTKTGSNVSTFTGNIVSDSIELGTINHEAGTIVFDGNTGLTVIDYNGQAGTTTRFLGEEVRTVANSTLTFGTLESETIFDSTIDEITILNTAIFTGSNGKLTGDGILNGPVIITNGGAISPREQFIGALTTGNLTISSGIFEANIDGITTDLRDQIFVNGTVSLTDAILNPTGGFPILPGDEVILINNDGTDPVSGTFNNLPEGGSVTFGSFSGIISYVGGDGNDIVLLADTEDPVAVCQDITLSVGIDGLTVTGDQVDGGSTDNAAIDGFLINGQPSIDFTLADVGANEVTITVVDPSGNTAECTATITLVSNVNATLPILISEYQPLPTVGNNGANQTVEIKGEPGESFIGTFVIIDGDESRSDRGLVVDVNDISGTFNAEGILTASVPNLTNPSHTAVLTSSFSGTVDVTDIDSNNIGTADDLSAFGIIFDAVGVRDGGVCCPVNVVYGSSFGGIDLVSIGSQPAAIFRDGSEGDFYQLSNTGTIYDSSGAIVDPSTFNTTPTVDGTFGTINPATVSEIVLRPIVYLQGAFTNPNSGQESLMRDDLRVAGLLPTVSPYGDGSTTTFSTAEPNNNIVDWVFVELRDATDSSVIIDSQAALVQRDGNVVSLDGSTDLRFNVPSGNYFVTINHRNHLGIITANPVALSETATTLDFSSDITLANGGSLALRDMGNGVFAMYAGDATGDGNILNTDITNTISVSGGINIYNGADVNMDGNILNDDIALFIQLNAGRIQQF